MSSLIITLVLILCRDTYLPILAHPSHMWIFVGRWEEARQGAAEISMSRYIK